VNPQSVKPITLALAAEQQVSALWLLPAQSWACLVLALGAGAGMHHPFMEAVSVELAIRGVASLRYQFPYMERGSKRPDAPALCHATVRAAVAEAARLAPGMPVFAGGKSFGGRMTSQAQAAAPLQDVRGLVFFGFPLHPAGRPSGTRAEHLTKVSVPLLFLQGTRDELASLELLEPLVANLGPRATLRIIPDADHSFHVRARSGRNDAAARSELIQCLAEWGRSLV
jgi:predicted alpha/beta-hydrolase family hydrolase